MVSVELDMIQTAGIGASALVVGMVLTFMLAFFTSVGFQSDLKVLKQGGRQ